MSPEFAEWLVQADANQGAEAGARLYEEYAGRGMYGKTTCAVQTDDVTALLLAGIWEAAENPHDVPAEKPEHLRTDNLGREYIAY